MAKGSNSSSSSLKTTTTSKGATVANSSTMTSKQVKAMQTALKNAGYDIGSTGADGIWGSKTSSALAQWKKDTGNSNTAGSSIGTSNYNKLVNGTSSGSSTKKSTTSNKSSSTTGSSTKTTTPYTGSYKVNGTNKAVNQDTLIAEYTNKVNEWTANQKSKGNNVYTGYDNYGVPHATTLGEDRLNEILNYYNSQETPVYGVGNTNYYIGSTPAVVKSVTSTNGNRNANVTYYADGTVDVTYDSSNGATPTVGDFIAESDGTYLYYVEDDDYGSYWAKGTPEQYEKYVSNYESNLYFQTIAQQEQEYLEAAQAANQAAVDKSVEEIKAELENGTGQYDQDSAEAYLQKLKAQQTQQLQNAYQGDLGGIGTKQYSDVTANYDQQMLQIALEKENFVNSCNQQINQLKAEGRLQDAEILAEWAQSKIDRYDEDYKWYEELKLSKAAQELDEDELQLSRDQLAAEIENADREYYYNRAVAMLEKGALTSDALEVLGVSSDWASKYADQINSTAAISLSYAKAQLDALVAETNALKTSSSSSSGGTTYVNTGGNNGGDDGDDGGDKKKVKDEYPYGSYTIYHADGSKSEVALDSNGELPDDALKDGDYMYVEGEKKYFDAKNGTFTSSRPKNTLVYNTADWLAAYKSLTGDTSTTDASTAKENLERKRDEALAKRKAATKFLDSLERSSSSQVTYNGQKMNSASARLKAKDAYAKYDKEAGTYQTLLNKYPS